MLRELHPRGQAKPRVLPKFEAIAGGREPFPCSTRSLAASSKQQPAAAGGGVDHTDRRSPTPGSARAQGLLKTESRTETLRKIH